MPSLLPVARNLSTELPQELSRQRTMLTLVELDMAL